ncbi:MAG TPA: TSUP family transporter [Burkholderiaceae bacterium]|nr:TSUP family transporter [Burkholderiaceae bacterium]
MLLTPVVLVTLAVATVATSFISGILGMAGGMILMGVLLALLPLPTAMMMHGIAQLAANGSRAFLLRKEIAWRVFAGYAAGAFLALALFVMAGLVADKATALIAMGLAPFAALALPAKLQLDVERRWHSFACGALCQVFSLTAGVSGPLLDAFFVRSAMSRHAVIATKAITQSLSHVMKIAYFGGVMAVAEAEVPAWVAAATVLLAFTGTSLSRQVLERISDAAFRNWTRWTVMALGAAYLASGVATTLQ